LLTVVPSSVAHARIPSSQVRHSGEPIATPNNPWGGPPASQHTLAAGGGGNHGFHGGSVSDADSWLNSTANFIDPFACVPVTAPSTVRKGINVSNGGTMSFASSIDTFNMGYHSPQELQQQQQQLLIQQQLLQQQQQLIQQQLNQQQQQQRLMEQQRQQQLLQQQLAASNFQRSATLPVNYPRPPVPVTTTNSTTAAWEAQVKTATATKTVDPFDSVWASKAKNPFQGSGGSAEGATPLPQAAAHAPTYSPVVANPQLTFQVKI